MASNTYQTYLMKGTAGSGDGITYNKLVDIKNYPDLGGSPELLETTTLSDSMRTNIFGIQGNDTMDFTCNYSKEDYNTVKALGVRSRTSPSISAKTVLTANLHSRAMFPFMRTVEMSTLFAR